MTLEFFLNCVEKMKIYLSFSLTSGIKKTFYNEIDTRKIDWQIYMLDLLVKIKIPN